jgi:hypothetical protein
MLLYADYRELVSTEAARDFEGVALGNCSSFQETAVS